MLTPDGMGFPGGAFAPAAHSSSNCTPANTVVVALARPISPTRACLSPCNASRSLSLPQVAIRSDWCSRCAFHCRNSRTSVETEQEQSAEQAVRRAAGLPMLS